MKTKTLNNKRSAIWIPLLLLTLVASACAYGWYLYRFPSWKEEVQLPDGRKIIVKQQRDFIEGYGTRRTWLTFALPEMGGKQTWMQWLYPTMIGVDNGKVYVVGRPRADKQFRMYRYPKYVYVAFEWKNDHFQRIPFLSVPEQLRKEENIRWCLPGGADSKKEVKPIKGWCSWPKPNYPAPYFARPKIVDLKIRIEEGLSWADLVNGKPASE